LTSEDKVSLSFGDTTVEYPVIPATQGPAGFDISGLMKDVGLTTLDQGFVKHPAPNQQSPISMEKQASSDTVATQSSSLLARRVFWKLPTYLFTASFQPNQSFQSLKERFVATHF